VGAAHPADTSYSILHSFKAAERSPVESLISDGRGSFYGATSQGGLSDGGTVYKVRSDGTGFQRLHSFAGGTNDGFSPAASLILDGSGNLYGTTTQGGASNAGTVFTLRSDGSDFRVLHSFAGGASDGEFPYASLTLDGSGSLYGTTSAGGSFNLGTVFRLKTNGGGFRLIHAFAGGAGDGRFPRASLLLDDSGNLYGTTPYGGQPPIFLPIGETYDGSGTVFRIKTDGAGFQLLHAFTFDVTGVAPLPDGESPSGSVTSDGAGNLYGMTAFGGSSSGGTVFKMKMDGTSFQILHSFAGGASDGREPYDSLVLDRSGNLYGVTQGEGVPGLQTIFKIRTDATGYQVLHTFVDANDGYTPSGSLILDGSETLFGTMVGGGSSYSGTLFSIRTDGSLFQALYSFAGFMSDAGSPSAAVIPDGSGYLYGTAQYGGFSYGGAVFRIRSDGSGFQLLHVFVGGDGESPESPLVLDRAGNLYGTTNLGGMSNGGTVFKMRTDGTGFQLLHTFLGGASDGLHPRSGLILDGADNLYGTTSEGGPAELGTVFRMRTDGTGSISSTPSPLTLRATVGPTLSHPWFWTARETSTGRPSLGARGSTARFSS
jgi:uncharacterized repeat protein (TIGR03803 family)